jgi:AbrB family looped-hinge helix DNA binding protein
MPLLCYDMIEKIKNAIFGNNRPTEIGFMPKKCRESERPKFKIRKEVNQQGGIYIPAAARRFDKRSDVEAGDSLSLDVFSTEYGGDGFNRYNFERHVDVTVNKGNRITIPKEVRDKIDIQEGDKIAVHAYWRSGKE